MKNNSTRETRTIRIAIERGQTELLFATSPDVAGLLVAKATIEEINEDLPRAIGELLALKGEDVLVTRSSDQDAPDLWLLAPAPNQ